MEQTLKGRGKKQGEYFIINQTGKGESTQYIPEVAEDIYRAKAKIRRKKKLSNVIPIYKRKRSNTSLHSKKKRRGRKTGKTNKKKRKRKSGYKSIIRRTIGGKIQKRRKVKRKR